MPKDANGRPLANWDALKPHDKDLGTSAHPMADYAKKARGLVNKGMNVVRNLTGSRESGKLFRGED